MVLPAAAVLRSQTPGDARSHRPHDRRLLGRTAGRRPFWGRFSDRYGRRPALLVGLFASAVAYVIFGLRGNDLAAVSLAARAGGGRRDHGSGPGLRRGHREAVRARQGAGLALRRDQRRRRDWAGDRLIQHAHFGPAAPGNGRGRALPHQRCFRLALAARVPQAARFPARKSHADRRSGTRPGCD